jgi:hypothetical protein
MQEKTKITFGSINTSRLSAKTVISAHKSRHLPHGFGLHVNGGPRSGLMPINNYKFGPKAGALSGSLRKSAYFRGKIRANWKMSPLNGGMV